MAKRVMVIGLDCAAPQYVFDEWLPELPTIRSLTERGQFGGHYMVDVENFRTDDKDRLLAEIEEMTEKRFRLAEHLLETRPWDLFFMVEMGTDRIHHGFWRFTDHAHRLFEAGNPYEHAMLDYYKRLDTKIARLLRSADDDTAVLVVSDHGAKRMDGGVCINEWLRREGYLVLKE